MTREEAIDLLDNLIGMVEDNRNSDYDTALKMGIKALKQEPRKGHWTYDRANVRCSCCGKGYKDFYGKANIASYNYCPNCGAKMEMNEE